MNGTLENKLAIKGLKDEDLLRAVDYDVDSLVESVGPNGHDTHADV